MMNRIEIWLFFLLLLVGCIQEPGINKDSEAKLVVEDQDSLSTISEEYEDDFEEEQIYHIESLVTGMFVWQSESRKAQLDIKRVVQNSFDFVLTIREEDVCNGRIEGHVDLDKDGKGKYSDEDCQGIFFAFVKNGISVKEYNCYEDYADKCPFDGFYQPEMVWSEDQLQELMDKLHMRDEEDFDFYASFTEPFWTFYIKGDQLLWEDFDQGHKLYEIDKRFDPEVEVQTIRYSNGKIRGELLIKKEEGTDGMSDITYPYHVIWNDSHHGGGATEFQKEIIPE